MPSRLASTRTRILGGITGVGLALACGLQSSTPTAAVLQIPNTHQQGASPRNVSSPPQSPIVPALVSNASSQRALIDRYCVTCHNQRLKTANLMLDQADIDKVVDDAELWEKVVAKLRGGAMPPAGSPRPDKVTSDNLAAWLETELDRAATVKPNAGRPGNHRLNRAEYVNAVRDLWA